MTERTYPMPNSRPHRAIVPLKRVRFAMDGTGNEYGEHLLAIYGDGKVQRQKVCKTWEEAGRWLAANEACDRQP